VKENKQASASRQRTAQRRAKERAVKEKWTLLIGWYHDGDDASIAHVV